MSCVILNHIPRHMVTRAVLQVLQVNTTMWKSYSLVYLFFFVHSEEAQEYVEIGSLNGLFVLGRTVGFIGKRA